MRNRTSGSAVRCWWNQPGSSPRPTAMPQRSRCPSAVIDSRNASTASRSSGTWAGNWFGPCGGVHLQLQPRVDAMAGDVEEPELPARRVDLGADVLDVLVGPVANEGRDVDHGELDHGRRLGGVRDTLLLRAAALPMPGRRGS